MTWLKKRLRQLKLYRKGPSVIYSPVPAVTEAIKVKLLYIMIAYTAGNYVYRRS